MEESSERESLLLGEHTTVSINRGSDESSSSVEYQQRDDSWWNESCTSSGSSSESGSESCSEVLDWEAEIDDRGQLFYIECNPMAESTPTEPLEAASKEPEVSSRKRHTTKAKIVRLLRRRSTRRLPAVPASAPKVTFLGSQLQVCVTVVPGARGGRRATACETLLGFTAVPAADEGRVVVAAPLHAGSQYKVGDWLRSIDGQEVSLHNIDVVLSTIIEPKEVTLQLQRVAACEAPNSLLKTSRSTLVERLIGTSNEEELATLLLSLPVGIAYVTMEGEDEGGGGDQGVIYCYPPPAAANTLAKARGCFLTLQHLLPQVAKSAPLSSSLLISGQLTHVTYTSEGKDLLLLALPDLQCSKLEAQHITVDVARCLLFQYSSLSKCFSVRGNHPTLHRMFALMFAQLLSGDSWLSNESSARSSQAQLSELLLAGATRRPQFEAILLASRLLALPREVQLQLDEALSELESSHCEDMSSSQRLFTIIGSCFYHRGCLLASHLHQEDLVDVTSYLRQRGLLHMNCREAVKSLIVWRRVYIASCDRGAQRGNVGGYILPRGKWFMLVVGKEHDLLVVLLESGGCSIRVASSCEPDLFYVEQAQETLAHIQKLHVSSTAAAWLSRGARPQSCGAAQLQVPGLVTAITSSSLLVGKKTLEVTSILKRRGPSPDRSYNQSFASDRSFNQSGFSERSPGFPERSLNQSLSSSVSEESASILSEVSDEAPVLGRRAERHKLDASRLSDSDSDSEYYRSDTHSCELPDKTPSFLASIERIIPSKLTSGAVNTMFHYVQLDLTEGTLVCPSDTTAGILPEVLDNFRRCSLQIHNLLQHAIRFKKLGVNETTNKALVGIKEHGILFRCLPSDADKSLQLAYWVIGRLFFTPSPKEVFICHEDSAPQNMVELAFRLSLNASG